MMAYFETPIVYEELILPKKRATGVIAPYTPGASDFLEIPNNKKTPKKR
jgi:hypothetical protein